MDREWEKNLDDERVVDLEKEDDPDAPPTMDPDERIEVAEPEHPLPDDERPV